MENGCGSAERRPFFRFRAAFSGGRSHAAVPGGPDGLDGGSGPFRDRWLSEGPMPPRSDAESRFPMQGFSADFSRFFTQYPNACCSRENIF